MSDSRPPAGRAANLRAPAVRAAVAALVLAVSGLAILAGTRPSGPPQPTFVALTSAGIARAGTRPISVTYTFDAGAGHPVTDRSAGHPLRVATAAGGTIAFVRHGSGYAIRFPSRCRSAASGCPRAILEGQPDNSLNPGTRGLRFGASVLMSRGDTGAGANVLQKGYSVGGITQYKLQVDGAAGRPSCVIASPSRIYKVVSPYPVDNGVWHEIVCTRYQGSLGMTVDGYARGVRHLPANLSIVNGQPLTVGGKGTTPNNDQFAGDIDSVFVTIS